MKYEKIDNEIIFECGCRFSKEKKFDGDQHSPNFNVNLNCEETYKSLSRGLTEGIFQLTSQLGHTFTKKLRPENMENIAALGSILRPACLDCISGDTWISTKPKERIGRKFARSGMKVEDLYKTFQRKNPKFKKNIISYDEETQNFIQNKIINVEYKGVQPVYKVNIKIRNRSGSNGFYRLKCTLNHKFLTYNKGWLKLAELSLGDRIAVLSNLDRRGSPSKNFHGERTYHNTCFYNYEYRCIFCDWKEAPLDVNHLEGTRQSNNDPQNLCFMCPNHHRMYTFNKITKEQIIEAREIFKLKNTNLIYWAEYSGCDYIGEEDTYDIEVESPHNNFIAGNFIVHNSKLSDGKSLTEHFVRRKNHEEDVPLFHPIIDKILETTYGIMCYQEQSMEIVKQCAGFTLQEADSLRKAIGKKIPEEMHKIRAKFLERTKSFGVLSEEQAIIIFDQIEAAQRYQFNSSHSFSYGLTGYITAYIKTHFPISFYVNWLSNEVKRERYKLLINEAKLFDLSIHVPDVRHLKNNFYNIKNDIYFGLLNIKGVINKDLNKLSDLLSRKEWTSQDIGKTMTWLEFLFHILKNLSSRTVDGFIKSGALDCWNKDRAVMSSEYEKFKILTDKELLIYDPEKHKELLDLLKDLSAGHTVTYNKKLEEYETKLVNRKIKEATRSFKTPLEEPKPNQRLAKIDKLISLLEEPVYIIQDTIDSLCFAEEELLGVALTAHSSDSIKVCAETNSCLDIANGYKGYATLRVKIDKANAWKCKGGASAGKYMCFLGFSDGTYNLDNCVAFPGEYAEFKHLLTKNNLVFVSGSLDKDSFIVKKAYPIS